MKARAMIDPEIAKKVAIVTSGIGEVIAKAFAAQGTQIVLHYLAEQAKWTLHRTGSIFLCNAQNA